MTIIASVVLNIKFLSNIVSFIFTIDWMASINSVDADINSKFYK